MSESAAHSSHKLMIASFDHAAATQERVCTHACVSVSTDGQYKIPAASCSAACVLNDECIHVCVCSCQRPATIVCQ